MSNYEDRHTPKTGPRNIPSEEYTNHLIDTRLERQKNRELKYIEEHPPINP